MQGPTKSGRKSACLPLVIEPTDLTGRLTDRLTDRQTDWLTDPGWLTDSLTNRQSVVAQQKMGQAKSRRSSPRAMGMNTAPREPTYALIWSWSIEPLVSGDKSFHNSAP